ncbi:MAG: Mg2+ transporter MgtE, partial [Halothiobacillaceae bacterium]
MENASKKPSRELVDVITQQLLLGLEQPLRHRLEEMHPAEVANLLESLPPEARRNLWEFIPPEHEGEILSNLRDTVRASIIGEMERHELVAAAESMDVEDLAEVIDELPENLTESLLSALDADHRSRLEITLAFEEESAGRLMSTDIIS